DDHAEDGEDDEELDEREAFLTVSMHRASPSFAFWWERMKGWPPLARRPSEWWAALPRGRGGGLLAGAALARRRDLRAERRLAFDGDVRAEEVEALLTHTFHLHQIALFLEGAVLRAIVDDALRCFRADARQKREQWFGTSA